MQGGKVDATSTNVTNGTGPDGLFTDPASTKDPACLPRHGMHGRKVIGGGMASCGGSHHDPYPRLVHPDPGAGGCFHGSASTPTQPGPQFASYRTYSWRWTPTNVSLMAQRIVDAVNVQLRAKGWTEVPTAACCRPRERRHPRGIRPGYLLRGPFGAAGAGVRAGAGGRAGAGMAVKQRPRAQLHHRHPGGRHVRYKSRPAIWRGTAENTVGSPGQGHRRHAGGGGEDVRRLPARERASAVTRRHLLPAMAAIRFLDRRREKVRSDPVLPAAPAGRR